MPLSVELGTPTAGRVPIILSGELDQSTAGLLRNAVRAALHLRPAVVCVDLALVTFMDSSGLAAIVVAKRWCDDAGCGLSLDAWSHTLLRRLHISGLTELFGLPAPPP
jgi:anti-sigma B factor antagonist